MIIEHRQGMAALPIEQREVALKVHLPQFVGYRAREALPGSCGGRALRFDETMAMQDRGDRAGRQLGTAAVQQTAPVCVHPQQLSDCLHKLSTSCSVAGSVRLGLRAGRRERSFKPAFPLDFNRRSHL